MSIDPNISFFERLESARQWRDDLKINHGIRHPVWKLTHKSTAHKWAKDMGLRVPENLATYKNIESLKLDDLPERFIIKPNRGSTSRGVYALSRRENEWFESFTNNSIEIPDLIAQYSRFASQDRISKDFLVQEFIDDGHGQNHLPIDWKFYTFNGKIGLILGREATGSRPGSNYRLRFFDENWNDVGNISPKQNVDPSLPMPKHPMELLEVARDLSRKIPLPFVRIDLYDSANGPYFGEVTPLPGSSPYIPEIDSKLGSLWRDTELQLEANRINDGQLFIEGLHG